ncbi:long-chain-fatty-acid--CoA ligase [Pelagibius sp.]|uniref:long-chain-fatty-acid--CoA ligase n=1 Tax=Pelagibius sp. TaxID=1931238 RepID=UPI003B50EDAD
MEPRWASAYPPGLDWRTEIASRPLFALLDDAAARYPEHAFLDFFGKKTRYRDAADTVERLAQGFMRHGVGKGVKVGLFLPNCPYFVLCFFAVLKAGGTVVAYNPLLAEHELERQIRDSESEVMVTLDLARLHEKLLSVCAKTRLRKIVVCRMTRILPFPKNLLFALMKHKEQATIPSDDLHLRFETLLDSGGSLPLPEIDPGTDTAALLYTGGTTGVPKGVCLTHDSLYANAIQGARGLTTVEPGRERVLAVLPFFHAFGMTAVMNTGIGIGAELILLPRFDVNEVLRTIDRHKPTLFAAVPTIYVAITAAPDLQSYDLSSLKLCTSGGDALPPQIKESFERIAGCKLLEGYGLTEASPVVTFNLPGATDKPGSIGLPMPRTTVEILSTEGRRTVLEPGETGEICVSGPQVMAGYWKHPRESADALIEGRLHTGDVGYIDDEGYVHLVDRLKDVIKTGGYTVYPSAIEAAIRSHPKVADVAVLGQPDPYWGQLVTAVIVPLPARDLEKGEILAFLEDRLSPIERPKRIEVRETLPRSVIGKILKAELLSELAEGSAQQDQGPDLPEA